MNTSRSSWRPLSARLFDSNFNQTAPCRMKNGAATKARPEITVEIRLTEGAPATKAMGGLLEVPLEPMPPMLPGLEAEVDMSPAGLELLSELEPEPEPAAEPEPEPEPAPESAPESAPGAGLAPLPGATAVTGGTAPPAGLLPPTAGAWRGEAVMVAVTPLPAMATVGAPAPVGLQTLQETVVTTKPGGTAVEVPLTNDILKR